MNQISRRAAEAFLAGRSFHRGNTHVYARNGVVQMFLFGVLIACRSSRPLESCGPRMWISCRGHATRTTLNRLNALLELSGNYDRLCVRNRVLRQRADVGLNGERLLPPEDFTRTDWGTARLDTAQAVLSRLLGSTPPGVECGFYTMDLAAVGPREVERTHSFWQRPPTAAPAIRSVQIVSTCPPRGIRKAKFEVLPLP